MPVRTVEDQLFGQVQQCFDLFLAHGLQASLHRLTDPQTLTDCQVMENEYCVPAIEGEEGVRQECSTVVHHSALNQTGSSGIDRYRDLLCLVSLQTCNETDTLRL